MHLKRIGGRHYWYESARVDGRFTSRCLGLAPPELVAPCKALAAACKADAREMKAAADERAEAKAKASAEALKAAREQARAIEDCGSAADAYGRDVESAVAVLLTSLGFHRRKRGPWRRKRTMDERLRKFMAAPGRRSEFRELARLAEAGDAAASSRVGELVEAARRGEGDLSSVAERHLMEIIPTAVADPEHRTRVEAYMEAMRRDLAPPGSGPVVRLLAARAALDWLHVNAWEQWFNHFARTASSKESALRIYQRNFDKAVGRYQRSLLAVERARRLSLPTTIGQVNIAMDGGRQVNQVVKGVRLPAKEH